MRGRYWMVGLGMCFAAVAVGCTDEKSSEANGVGGSTGGRSVANPDATGGVAAGTGGIAGEGSGTAGLGTGGGTPGAGGTGGKVGGDTGGGRVGGGGKDGEAGGNAGGGRVGGGGADGRAGGDAGGGRADGGAGGGRADGDAGGGRADGGAGGGLEGSYDLLFGTPTIAPRSDSSWQCGGTLWQGTHAQLTISLESELRATLAADWHVWVAAASEITVLEDRLEIDWGGGQTSPWLGVSQGIGSHTDYLTHLSLPIDDGVLADTGEVQISGHCTSCEVSGYADATSSVTVAPDRTAPQARLGDPWRLGAYLPFVPFELQVSEPVVDLAERVEVHDAAGLLTSVSMTSLLPSPITIQFDDWDEVAGTTQTVTVPGALVDAAGNASTQETALAVEVLPVDTPFVGAESDAPVMIALWGDSRLTTSAEDPSYCPEETCVVLEPDVDPSDGEHSWVAGIISNDGAERVRIRYRAFLTAEPRDTRWLSSVLWYPRAAEGTAFGASSQQTLNPWNDSELYAYASDWTWIEVPLSDAEPQVGFTLVNQEAKFGESHGCAPIPTQIVIDRVWVE